MEGDQWMFCWHRRLVHRSMVRELEQLASTTSEREKSADPARGLAYFALARHGIVVCVIAVVYVLRGERSISCRGRQTKKNT